MPMSKMIFTPNGGEPVNVDNLQDIVTHMGSHLDGFSRIENDGNMILAYIQEDPTPICIGKITRK